MSSLAADCLILTNFQTLALYRYSQWFRKLQEFPAIRGIYFEYVTVQRSLVKSQTPGLPAIIGTKPAKRASVINSTAWAGFTVNWNVDLAFDMVTLPHGQVLSCSG